MADIRWYRNLEDRIAREQRKLSHMIGGSNNYYDQLRKIGRLSEKVSNRRKDYLHKLSRSMADEFDAVVVEDIDLRAMSQALHFGKAVHDNGFGMFRTMLAYKLCRQGKVLVKVDRFYPSSQLCFVCGYKNPAVRDLKVREWTCPECGAHHDRDRNAAINLRGAGKALLNRWASGDSSLTLTPSGVLSEKKPPLQSDAV